MCNFLLSFKIYAHILLISQWQMLIIHEAVHNEILIIYHYCIYINHRHIWKDGRKASRFVVGFLSHHQALT